LLRVCLPLFEEGKVTIVVAHYRFTHDSGPERYLFNVMELLQRNGNKVIPFSINYDSNEYSPYSKYFIEPISGRDSFHYSTKKDITLGNKVKIIRNAFFNWSAYHALQTLLSEEKPDIVYVLQFWGKLSVSIIQACFQMKVPVILRFSDYGLLCARNIFFRDSSICTKCINRQFYSVIFRCVQNSLLKSLINFCAYKYSYAMHFQDKVSAIVTPSNMMRTILKSSVYFRNKRIFHIPTFIPAEEIVAYKSCENNLKYTFCYIGRISEDKGIDVLLRALLKLKERGLVPETIVVGDTNTDYARQSIQRCIDDELENVLFVGRLEKAEINGVLRDSRFGIVPSIWYDNMPNSLIESQAAGLPVIASNIGSLPEMITHETNGYLFKSGDADDLMNILSQAMALNDAAREAMVVESLEWASSFCSAQKHYDHLMAVFTSAFGDNGK
jgi:glycosyltransferase involved in cell wall biosynthesis